MHPLYGSESAHINGITNIEYWLNDVAAHLQPMILEMALNLASGYHKDNDPIYGYRSENSDFGKAVVAVWEKYGSPRPEDKSKKDNPEAEQATESQAKPENESKPKTKAKLRRLRHLPRQKPSPKLKRQFQNYLTTRLL